MFLKVLFIIAVAAEFVTVPMFLKYYWPQKCKQSLIFKMISATLFVLAGFLAMKISGNNTSYATLIMWGLALGWVGDLLLHSLSDNKLHFVIGFISFLAGHVVYIVAFHKAIKKTYPAAPAMTWYEALCVIAIVAVILAIFIVRKLFEDKKVLLVAFAIYGLILGTMLVKAFRYAIGEIIYGTNDHMVMICVTMALGALLFSISDVLLGFIIGKGETKRIGRIINIVTYFAAQILIASSIFFVKSPLLLV